MSLMFLPHFDVLLKRRTATWNIFINQILQDCAAHYYRDTSPDVKRTNSFGPNFGETNRIEQGSNVNQTDCDNMILLHLKKAFFLETLVPPYTFSESTVRLSLTCRRLDRFSSFKFAIDKSYLTSLKLSYGLHVFAAIHWH